MVVLAGVAKSQLCRLTCKRNLAASLRQINSTGKSLPIYGSHVKPRNKKYFAFTETKSVAHIRPSRPDQRGVGHRHDEGRVAMDADVATDERG